jgi:hypothetical protein
MLKWLILFALYSIQIFLNFTNYSQPKTYFFSGQKDSLPKKFEVINALPKHYVTDGSVDYTKFIQDAINKHPVLVFPKFPLLINQSGLKIPSQRDIYFTEGGSLKLIDEGNNAAYRILLLKNVKNVNIYYPVINVKDNYNKNKSIGIGIAVYSSKNVQIIKPVVKNCSGDGIYIGQNMGALPSENIIIDDAVCDSNKRNGLTITSGKNINIKNGIFLNTNGKLPMAGIDIEPNNEKNELNNIKIENVLTINNKEKGIQVGLSKFFKDSCKPIQIDIINHKDSASALAMVISCGKANKCDFDKNMINVVNPVWKNNQSQVFKVRTANKHVSSVSIKNPTIIQNNNKLKNTEMQNKLVQNSNAVRVLF